MITSYIGGLATLQQRSAGRREGGNTWPCGFSSPQWWPPRSHTHTRAMGLHGAAWEASHPCVSWSACVSPCCCSCAWWDDPLGIWIMGTARWMRVSGLSLSAGRARGCFAVHASYFGWAGLTVCGARGGGNQIGLRLLACSTLSLRKFHVNPSHLTDPTLPTYIAAVDLLPHMWKYSHRERWRVSTTDRFFTHHILFSLTRVDQCAWEYIDGHLAWVFCVAVGSWRMRSTV
jgi:hypothetical protein